jgi:SAM-dependent methyltransferase
MSLQAGDASSSSATAYVFDNAGKQTPRRFAALPIVFDPGTIRHLIGRCVGPGWRCLEVGAGSGSVAAWLAERVGATGHVLATDIDTRFLQDLDLPNLEVQRHDIGVDPLPEDAFDLVHARLVLEHVPDRDTALRQMALALRPGGWLVVEDFGLPDTLTDPVLDPSVTLLKAHAVMLQVVDSGGVDLRYGRRLPGRLRPMGLVEIGGEEQIIRFMGGSAGAEVTLAGLEQLREPILASGLISEDEYRADLALLEDPEFAYSFPLLCAVWARRPISS